MEAARRAVVVGGFVVRLLRSWAVGGKGLMWWEKGRVGAMGVDGSIVEDNELGEGHLLFEVSEQMISYVNVLCGMVLVHG
jgi:hypothetical protein